MRAAEPFVRIRIRVPEAYVLLLPYTATRPGLLVLDADGRRVDALTLVGRTPAELASWLAQAAEREVEERLVFDVEGEGHEAFLKALGSPPLRGKTATLTGKRSPFAVEALAREHGVTLRWRDPVPVRRAQDTPAAPGVRAAREERAFVSALLLDPKRVGATDVVARRFVLKGVSIGPPGARVALAPGSVPGVLTVFPDLFHEAFVVVGRKGAIDWEAVAEAFRRAGVEPR